MGNAWTQLFGRLFQRPEPELRVGMLGLDNAGKTTILYQLKLERNVQPLPTIGFNVENIRCGKLLLNIWDVSGNRPRTRLLWQHYNRQQTRAIIFVVDAADVRRLGAAADELRWLLWQSELAHAVFLVLANKQDLAGALSAAELVGALDLHTLPHHWAVQECCALNGAGLAEALQQLQRMLSDGRRGTARSRRRTV